MMHFIFKSQFILLCCIKVVFCTNVFAIPIDVKAEFYFGPDLSRNQACENARESAKSKAIAMVSGEKISFDQQLQCFQKSRISDERKCEINQNTAFLVEGQISKSETISETIRTVPGAQVCTVLMVVDVIPPSLESDPSFDFKFEINRTNFRQGDNLIINITPSKMMYVYIFNWRSALNKENVIKIFPNEIDKDNFINKSITIPSKNSDSKYSFELEWDAPLGYDKDYMNESIIVVATKKPVDWLPGYDIKRFKEKIMEIPLHQRRVVRKSFMLFR
jgi:hypothetical protein